MQEFRIGFEMFENVILLSLSSQDGVFQLLSSTVESGRLKCPFDPLQPFTSVLTGKTSQHTIVHRGSPLPALSVEHQDFTNAQHHIPGKGMFPRILTPNYFANKVASGHFSGSNTVTWQRVLKKVGFFEP